MKKSHLFRNKVKAIEVSKGKRISEILAEMSQTGFQGRKLAEALKVLERMLKDPRVTIFMGYAGSLSTAGQWKIIQWLIENHYIDVLVSTGANISEDIVEAMGFSYYQYDHPVADKTLFQEGYNRYYDVCGKESDYYRMTELIAEFILTLKENHPYSSREFLAAFGRWLEEKGIESLVASAAREKIPIFCPAIIDSPYGDAALIAKSKGFHLTLDAVKDYVEFMSLAEKIQETGVIYIGGGVPKDFIQLLAVTSDLLYADLKVPNKKGKKRAGTHETYYPHKYALQITTDSPQWGGLSGATFEEAISWGKEQPEGGLVQCYCDATIALPILSHALAEKMQGKRRGTDFSRFFLLT